MGAQNWAKAPELLRYISTYIVISIALLNPYPANVDNMASSYQC